MKKIVAVRNIGSEPIPLSGQYLFAGETRQVSLHVAEAAIANHTGRLVKVGDEPVQAEVEQEETDLPASDPLKGLVFTLAGSFEAGRDFWANRIEAKGGTIDPALTVDTSYLVAGTNPGKKVETAGQLNIPVLTEQELAEKLG